MTNYIPGFYWVYQRGKSPKPTIGRLMKNGGWEYMESEHSHKLIGNKPDRILKKIDDYEEEDSGHEQESKT